MKKNVNAFDYAETICKARKKGILLTNLNFNAFAIQTATASQCLQAGDIMLSVMPVFHGRFLLSWNCFCIDQSKILSLPVSGVFTSGGR